MATSRKQYKQPEKHVFNTTLCSPQKDSLQIQDTAHAITVKDILSSCQKYINVLHNSSHDLPSQVVNIHCFLRVTTYLTYP